MQPRPVLLFAFSSCLELKVGRKKEKKNCKKFISVEKNTEKFFNANCK
jgi:hypothetical protein